MEGEISLSLSFSLSEYKLFDKYINMLVTFDAVREI